MKKNTLELISGMLLTIFLSVFAVVVISDVTPWPENQIKQEEIVATTTEDISNNYIEIIERKSENTKILETGIASWYDYQLKDYGWISMTNATAASRTLTRYEHYKVTNIANGKSIVVYINDCVVNPKVIIDLSSYAFGEIAQLRLGLINVKIEKYEE